MTTPDVTTRSPLRYPGGKTRAVKILLPYFPEDTSRVISPFFGGGSVELALTGKGIDVTAGDAFPMLATFWQMTLYRPEDLADAVSPRVGHVTKSDVADCQRRLREANISPPSGEDERLSLAADFFTVNRCSFSGATLSGGCSQQAIDGRFTPSSVERIRTFVNDRVTVECVDCLDLISQSQDGDILFLDPPYLLGGSRESLYGVSGDQHDSFDHKAFRDAVMDSQRPFVLTYNDCEQVREMWSGCVIEPAEWSYGMNASKKSSEVIITR